MTSGKDDEEFFRQRGFGIKIGFGERPALMMIDMINGFTDASMPLGANLDQQIEAQKPLLEIAHERDIPVIFSTVLYEEPDIKDAGIWALKQSGARTLTAGSEAVKVDTRLERRPKDILLVKKYASCFFGTDLVPAAQQPAHRHPHSDRLYHLGLRTRDRSRCGAEWLSSYGGA